jgi:hypothetical protein
MIEVFSVRIPTKRNGLACFVLFTETTNPEGSFQEEISWKVERGVFAFQ